MQSPLTVANLATVDFDDIGASTKQVGIMTDPAAAEHNSNEGSGSDCDSEAETIDSSSTYRYSHEPFQTFEAQVQALGESIGNFDSVKLQRARGGANNRVVIAYFQADFKTASGIFRIPRSTQYDWEVRSKAVQSTAQSEDQDDVKESGQEIVNQVAVHQWLRQQGIPAPEILAFDSTSQNALALPYTLLAFSTGIKLEDIYYDLPLEAKKSIVDQLIDFWTKAECLNFDDVGLLSEKQDGDFPSAWSSFTDPALQTPEIAITGFGVNSNKSYGIVSPTRDLKGFLLKHLEASRLLDLKTYGMDWLAIPDHLLDILQEMLACEYLAPLYGAVQRNVLHHWDLEPRNIIVKRQDEGDPASVTAESYGRLIIDNIIDWDDVQSVPSIITRKPPVWLWDEAGEDFVANAGSREFALTADDELPSFYTTGIGSQRITDDDRAIKAYFEETYVAEMQKIYPDYSREIYMQEAYGTGAFIRRFVRFAMAGARNSWEEDRLKRFSRDWDKELMRVKNSRQQVGKASSWLTRLKQIMRVLAMKVATLGKGVVRYIVRARVW